MLEECCDKRAVEEEIRRRIIDAYAAGHIRAIDQVNQVVNLLKPYIGDAGYSLLCDHLSLKPEVERDTVTAIHHRQHQLMTTARAGAHIYLGENEL